MFAVTEQDGLWTLRDDTAPSQAMVLPHRGGIVLSWSVGDREVLYLDRERFANPELSIRGGIPLLFPICGNLAEDSYTWQGQTYKLSQHGFARNLPWEVTDHSIVTAASLTVTLVSNAQTLAVYPFPFRLDYVYSLQGNRLELKFRHTNTGTEPMPFATGIHPYFLAPDKHQLSFHIPAHQFIPKGETTPQPFSGAFDFDREEIDVALMPLTDRVAKVIDRARNLELTLTYDDHYSTLVFWTVKGKDFYCLEPWSAPRNALNTGAHLLRVEPGETLETIVGLQCTK
jgi:galactose mutarotase-like enzyme